VRCRFDVVAIVWPGANGDGDGPETGPPPSIEHIRDAFPSTLG
jgi:hypothetical protein